MKKINIFNFISPVYGVFFDYQVRNFKKVIEENKSLIDSVEVKSIIDVGCGTGALCKVLYEKGYDVAGIDSSPGMIEKAKKKTTGLKICFKEANILEKLVYEDNQFDMSVASYVAHGMNSEQRKTMYAEMKRISDKQVIIYDYNKERAILTDIIERMEGKNYFDFIRNPEREMNDVFSSVKVYNVHKRGAWYVCSN